jgi:hypothetical protein
MFLITIANSILMAPHSAPGTLLSSADFILSPVYDCYAPFSTVSKYRWQLTFKEKRFILVENYRESAHGHCLYLLWSRRRWCIIGELMFTLWLIWSEVGKKGSRSLPAALTPGACHAMPIYGTIQDDMPHCLLVLSPPISVMDWPSSF